MGYSPWGRQESSTTAVTALPPGRAGSGGGTGGETDLHASQGVNRLPRRHDPDSRCLPGGPAVLRVRSAVTMFGQKQVVVN